MGLPETDSGADPALALRAEPLRVSSVPASIRARESGPTAKELRRAQHKARMRKRREAQLARQPGFTPMPNKRLLAATRLATLQYQMEGWSAPEAADKALKFVAARLPRPRMVRSFRVKPSKSDSPEYRKANRVSA